MRRLLLLLIASLCACASELSAASDLSDEMPEDLPAGGCRDTDVGTTSGSGTDGLESCDAATTTGLATTSSTTGESTSECVGEGDCEGAGACVAEWADGERGPFQCQFACIPTLDEASWCSDDASCCDADAICTPRGYCVVVGDLDGGSSTGG